METGIEGMARLDADFIQMPNRSPQLIEVEENLNLLTDSKEISEHQLHVHPLVDGGLDGD